MDTFQLNFFGKARKKGAILAKARFILKNRDYQVLRSIGGGSFGDVYEVRSSKEMIKMAVKVVPAEKASREEMSLWQNFDHPNVLPLLDHIHEQGVNLFFMPLQPKTLFNLMMKNDFRMDVKSFEYTKKWMSDILSGLEYMHNMHTYHMDLKIDNILITSDMKAVICDFSMTTWIPDKIERYFIRFIIK